MTLATPIGATVSALFSPTVLLNAVAPMGGITREPNLRYGSGPRQTLDLYLPEQTAGAPIVVFFYGGSWQRGDKETYKFVASTLARRGMIVAIPDYSVYPDALFPGFLEDSAMAVAWIADWARRNASARGTDPRRLVLMGHSAGGHIAAMLAYDARWLTPHGLDPRRDLAGLVGLAGPYDFLPIQDPVIKIIFAHPRPETTQPITFVTGGEAPTLLGFAPSDTVVRPGNSQRLAGRLSEKGSPVALKSYPRTSHTSLIGSFSPLLRVLGSAADDTADFIRALPPARGS